MKHVLINGTMKLVNHWILKYLIYYIKIIFIRCMVVGKDYML